MGFLEEEFGLSTDNSFLDIWKGDEWTVENLCDKLWMCSDLM